jgi:hypothetical protein
MFGIIIQADFLICRIYNIIKQGKNYAKGKSKC